MLTRIVHNSQRLCTFFDQLEIELSKPQRQHILNMADALLVCEDKKTLAALQRQFIEAPDASNMADFLRISPWHADEVRTALRADQVAWIIARAEQAGAPRVIYIDDSLGEKDKDTRHLEPVDWFHDRSESTKNKPRYKNSFCYLAVALAYLWLCCLGVMAILAGRAKLVDRTDRRDRSLFTLGRQWLNRLLKLGQPILVSFCPYPFLRQIPSAGVG